MPKDPDPYPLTGMVRGLASRWLVGWVVVGGVIALWSAAAHGPAALAHRPRPPRSTPLGKPVRLVHKRLPGGYLSIVGQAYEIRKTWRSTDLQYRFEEKYGAVASEGAPIELQPNQRGVMNVVNVHGRLGLHLYAVVYGVLRRSRDSVVARTSARQITVHRVVLPALLHSRGVLVYMVVNVHSRRVRLTVTAYTASGRIDSRKQCIGLSGGCWQKAPVGR